MADDPRTLSQGNALNSAQRSALQSHYESQVREIVSALQLRKWVVEKLIEKSTIAVPNAEAFLVLADRVHTFIVGSSTLSGETGVGNTRKD